MKITRNHYLVRYKRENNFSADNDNYLSQRAEAILKKCPKMRPGYTLCTLSGKELNTGHNSSPNSELSYCIHID